MLRFLREGFTLVEILVVLAIGIVLAAAVLPSLIGGVDRTRVDESAESLQSISEAVSSMWKDVGRYPGKLSHLTTPITTGQNGICGTAYTAAQVATWAGPYLNRTVAGTGLPLPVGVARDSFSYDATVSPLLRVHVDSVTHRDVRALNAALDADADSAAGAVRWGPISGSGLAELVFVRPIRAC